MNQNRLEKIARAHKRWLDTVIYRKTKLRTIGIVQRANLSGQCLCGLDLSNYDFSYADFRCADMSSNIINNTKFHQADLNSSKFNRSVLNNVDLAFIHGEKTIFKLAELNNVNMYGSHMQYSNFRASVLKHICAEHAEFESSSFFGAYLYRTSFSYSSLDSTDFTDAVIDGDINLNSAKLNEKTNGLCLACPEIGAFIGYKKAMGKIITLEIPADAKRSSATTKKCRCSKAKVLKIENFDGTISNCQSVHSNYDKDFIYEIGKTVSVPEFDENRWKECSPGIHFFMNKEIAKNY